MQDSQSDTHLDRWLLRGGIAFIWLWTGLAVLHPTYQTIGSDFLMRLGLPPSLMFITCALEVVLSLCVLVLRPQLWLTAIQLALIVGFTLILAVLEPALLVNPFGMLSKNVTLAALIVTAQLVESEGWTVQARRTLLAGFAFIWAWEGLMACILFQGPELRAVLSFTGLDPDSLRVLLTITGFGQILAGAALLLLRGRLLRLLLLTQAVGLVLISILVTIHDANLWFHPFGPVSKNISLIAGTIAASLRATHAASLRAE